MSKRDEKFWELNRQFEALHERFKFWNGFSFGMVIAMFLTIGDARRYFVALGFWLFGTIFSAIYQHKSGKALKEMDKLVKEGK